MTDLAYARILDAQDDSDFTELLEESLRAARKRGKEELSSALYEALQWPVTVAGYIEYLDWFQHWVPQQSSDPALLEPGTEEHQEVYDRLCHFYFLIDQPVGKGGKVIVEDVPWFAEWLVEYADGWGEFLDSPDSFDDAVLQSFIDESPMYRVEDSLVDGKPNAPSGWLTFNQFFARELNPGLRPIARPDDNRIVVSPADCTYKAQYAIDADSAIPEITVKGTHKYASVEDLLADSQYRGSFANGRFVHYFLGPYSYHRFHTPVAGRVMEVFPVQGLVYLDVDLADGQFDAPDSSEGGYEFAQARGVITIDTRYSPFGDVGIVAVVPIGMCQVSSVHMTAVPGTDCLKGDEFGYFLFGGSDIIVLFQEGARAAIDDGTGYRHYGTPIASCRTLS